MTNRTSLLWLVVDKLRSLTPEQFDYGHWASEGFAENPGCGTTACALGWATTIPEIQEAGLVMVSLNGRGSNPTPAAGRDSLGEYAAVLVFDLSVKDALYLFVPRVYGGLGTSPARNATPAEVADHIERYLLATGVERVT